MGKNKVDSLAKYRYKIPESVTVEIDSREQFPILFPAYVEIAHPERPAKILRIEVKTVVKKLVAGDYRLAEYPSCCVIERKASQLELFKNLWNHYDQVRQAKAFRKLAACEFPYLLIEATPAELLASNPNIPNPELLVHRIGLALAKYGFSALWIGWGRTADNRRKLGTLLVHLMLSAALRLNYELLPTLVDDDPEPKGDD